jgi:AraC-like DNA-binding protein
VFAAGSERWSTEIVPAKEALDYWVATVCDHLLEMQIESPARLMFQGELWQARFGICGLSMIDAEAQEIRRTREMIGRSRFTDYRLLYFRSGGGIVAQRGRSTTVSPGECVLLDSTETYQLRFPLRTSCTVLSLPREWLSSWIRTPERLIAMPLDVNDGWGSALSSWMRCIKPEALERLSMPPAVLAEQIAALIAMAGDDRGLADGPVRNPLHDRLLATLRERCGEQGLSPSVVALQHRISTRYLHMLFANAGMTFCDTLMAIRLEQAQRMLADARYTDLPIGEIAARCGFNEPSHFARRFRERFGHSPTKYRTIAVPSGHPARLVQQAH